MRKFRSRLAIFGLLMFFFFLSCNLYLFIFCVEIIKEKELSNYCKNTSRFIVSEKHISVCKEKQNFVFVKCMKCATETMGTIIRRFGLVRNLNFVLPNRYDTFLGWPYVMKAGDHRLSRRPYNILMEHAIFNLPAMQKIMPNDTIYITLIREPLNHFLSSFHYFALPEISDIQGPDPVIEYFNDIYLYEARFKSSKAADMRPCIPNGFSVTKNLQSHCLGMPLGFPKKSQNITVNETAVEVYIGHLDRHLNLVMILEYFQESLVLLKRMMCWSLKDILLHEVNVGNYKHKQLYKQEIRMAHKQWSALDYKLYDHFNKTLWRKINREGANFHKEVERFKFVQGMVSDFCFRKGNWNTSNSYTSVLPSEFNAKFTVTSADCRLMKMYLLPTLKTNYDKTESMGLKRKKGSLHWPPTRGCSIPGLGFLVEKISLEVKKFKNIFPYNTSNLF